MDVSSRQGGAHVTAGYFHAVEEERRHDRQADSRRPAQRCQCCHVAFASTAETEVGSLHQYSRLQAFADHLSEELGGAKGQQLMGGTENEHLIDAGCQQQLGAVLWSGQAGRRLSGAQQLDRVGIESQNDGRHAEGVGLAAQFSEQGGMTTMHAVEVADADRAAAAVARRRRLPIDRINRHVPIPALLRCICLLRYNR